MKILRLFRVKFRRFGRPVRRQAKLAMRLPLNRLEQVLTYSFLALVLSGTAMLLLPGFFWILKSGLGISPSRNIMELATIPGFFITMIFFFMFGGLASKAWSLDAFASRENCLFCGYRARGLPLAGAVPGFHNCPECGEIIVTLAYTKPEKSAYLRKEAEEASLAVTNFRKRHSISIRTVKWITLASSFGALACGIMAATILALNKSHPGVVDGTFMLEPSKITLVLFGTSILGVPPFFIAVGIIFAAPLLIRMWQIHRLSPLLRKERRQLYLEYEERAKRGVEFPSASNNQAEQGHKPRKREVSA